jgi:hypothetical protein
VATETLRTDRVYDAKEARAETVVSQDAAGDQLSELPN